MSLVHEALAAVMSDVDHVAKRDRNTHQDCAVAGCDRGRSARGWCRRHYESWRRHGDPLGAVGLTFRSIAPFHAKDTAHE